MLSMSNARIILDNARKISIDVEMKPIIINSEIMALGIIKLRDFIALD